MFDMIFNMLEYEEKLLDHAQAHPSAYAQKLDHCVNCGTCCLKRPGNLTKADFSRLAEHLKMSRQEFFRQFCMVDIIRGTLGVILRRQHQTGGKWVSVEETWSVASPCVFYSEDGCRVHKIKPTMCARTECWDQKPLNYDQFYWSEEEMMELGWDGEVGP